MKLTLLCILFHTFISVNAQLTDIKIDLSRWDEGILKKANTAVKTDYLTGEEKEVIFITNLARINGPLFCETILNPYLEGKPKTKYTRSLIRDLTKIRDLSPLIPQKDLYTIANLHALNSGKKGSVGHEGFDRRFKPLLGKYTMVAENCAYGFEDGATIAIQLLIDEGVSNYGHRKNMLSQHYNSIGVSIQTHKKYRNNCVMDFGKMP